MRQVTQTWIDKPEGDLLVAQQSLASTQPVFDAICFHAQQCVEKYLKAWLQEQGIAYPRTPDLPMLVSLASGTVTGLAAYVSDFQWLSTSAVDVRYPGTSTTRPEAERALRLAADARSLVRAALGFPTT